MVWSTSASTTYGRKSLGTNNRQTVSATSLKCFAIGQTVTGLQTCPPDIVLSPDMAGGKLISISRKEAPECKILIHSLDDNSLKPDPGYFEHLDDKAKERGRLGYSTRLLGRSPPIYLWGIPLSALHG